MWPLTIPLCTTFVVEAGGERVVGKCYDWHLGPGLVGSRAARAVAEHTYAESRAVAAAGAPRDHPPAGAGCLERFVRASRLAARPEGATWDCALRVLDSVNNSSSQWHIVYDQVKLQ